MQLAELARLTGAEVEGDGELEITGAAGLDEAEPGHVTFLANPRYTPRVQTTRASAIYLAAGSAAGREIAVLRARDPYLAYTRALRLFYPEPAFEPFIHSAAVLDPTARLDEQVWIGACAVIGRTGVLASGVPAYPYATFYDDVTVAADT